MFMAVSQSVTWISHNLLTHLPLNISGLFFFFLLLLLLLLSRCYERSWTCLLVHKHKSFLRTCTEGWNCWECKC